MSVGRSGVEVVGDGSPSMLKVQVDRARGVVGVEHHAGGHDVVGWVKRVKGRSCTIHEPEDIGALLTVQHPSTVGIRIGPIRSGLVFCGIGNAIAVKIVRLDVVGRIVFRVRPVEVFTAVVNPALVGVKGG